MYFKSFVMMFILGETCYNQVGIRCTVDSYLYQYFITSQIYYLHYKSHVIR